MTSHGKIKVFFVSRCVRHWLTYAKYTLISMRNRFLHWHHFCDSIQHFWGLLNWCCVISGIAQPAFHIISLWQRHIYGEDGHCSLFVFSFLRIFARNVPFSDIQCIQHVSSAVTRNCRAILYWNWICFFLCILPSEKITFDFDWLRGGTDSGPDHSCKSHVF